MEQKALEIVGRIHEILKNRGLTLSVAESCTGGLISHYLTFLPGSSTFFSVGIVSYAEETKINILHMTPETISEHGAVSEETAREMAEKVRLLAKTDCSVSSTGNLGPDVLEGKEEGLVYIAAANKEKTIFEKLQLHGNREANKEEAAIEALELLIKLVED
jgi:PncC family amidohydrolase